MPTMVQGSPSTRSNNCTPCASSSACTVWLIADCTRRSCRPAAEKLPLSELLHSAIRAGQNQFEPLLTKAKGLLKDLGRSSLAREYTGDGEAATLPLEWWFKRRGLLSAAPE